VGGDPFSFSYLRSITECTADKWSAPGLPEIVVFSASIVTKYKMKTTDSVASDISIFWRFEIRLFGWAQPVGDLNVE
jgi:hypothetical protein